MAMGILKHSSKHLLIYKGINLAVGRLGSVLNDLLSPHIAYWYNVAWAVWFGTITCIASFGCCQTLIWLDSRYKDSIDSEADLELKSLDSVSPREPKTRPISVSFWIVCAIMCLYYAADIPFNAIHSSFLQTKWYKGNPKLASQIMAVPDTISAIMVPFVGTFVDRYGHRCKVMIVTGCIMVGAHLYFAFATASSPSPIPVLVLLGLAYAMLLTFWPCIPLIVSEDCLSTALYFLGGLTSQRNCNIMFERVSGIGSSCGRVSFGFGSYLHLDRAILCVCLFLWTFAVNCTSDLGHAFKRWHFGTTINFARLQDFGRGGRD